MATFSPLISYQKISTHNTYGARGRDITRITPHCFVGYWDVKSMVNYLAKAQNASVNYCIAADGQIGGNIPEENAAWTSSSADNDRRAITIECASDKKHPYAFTQATYKSLIQLCVDICNRYGKTKLLYLGSKQATLKYQPKANEMVLTAHCWFKNKACPGEWLLSRYGELADEVTKQLNKHEEAQSSDDYTLVFNAQDYKYYNKDLRHFDDYWAFIHFISYGMKQGRHANQFFDINYYKNKYPDLKAAFGEENTNYYLHYMRFGLPEGRWPIDLSPIFNLQYYKNKYKDLRDAFGDNDGSYVTHFMIYGMVQGRQACEGFNPEAYRLRYSDLNKAFKNDYKAYFKHYLQFGLQEGRVGN